MAMKQYQSHGPTGRLVRVIFVVVTAFTVFSGAYYWPYLPATDLSFLALTALAVSIAARRVKLPGADTLVSAAEPLFFIILLKFGATAAVLTATLMALVLSTEEEARRGWRLTVGIRFSVSLFGQGIISAVAAGLVAYYLPAALMSSFGIAPNSLGARVFLLAAVSLARFLPQAVPAVNLAELRHIGFWQTVRRREWRAGFAAYFLTAVSAQFVLLMVEHAEVYSALLSLVVLTVFYFAYRYYAEKFAATERHAAEAQRHAEEIAALHLRTIEALTSAIAAKDRGGHKHAQRVLAYAEGLAPLLGLNESERKALRAAALLHDIGKLAIPDYILNKPGQLSPAEMEKMQTHPVVGASILERVGFPYPLVPTVRHYHEHWDGSGYPDRLRGTAIPLTARILAVVDAFDAALHQWPFYHPKAKEQAVRLLLSESGRKYDPEVVRQFIAHLPLFEEKTAHLQPSHSTAVTPPDAIISSAHESADPPLSDTLYLDAIRGAQMEAAEMLGLAQALSSTLNLEETVSIVMARLSRLVAFDACAIYLADDAGHTATVSGAIGSLADHLRGHRVVIGQGVVGRAMAEGQMAFSASPLLNSAEPEQVRHAFGSVTAYPLVRAEKVVAVISLLRFSAEPYNGESVRRLAGIAPLAADAIHNATTYRRTEARALTDALTGLPNSRVLHSVFDQERNRAERHGNRLAILMIDLDGFKQINDTFGHQAGDEVLREVAQSLKHELRGGDTLLRYAGDEFVAILHDTEESCLDELLRRIQDSLAARSHFIAGRDVRLSASIGYAIYGKDGKELEELMHTADLAMYCNKTERTQRSETMVMAFSPGKIQLPHRMQSQNSPRERIN